MAITKVVIAAAGQGTRMLELTKDQPKHIIEVENKPFLFYLLDNLFLAGYREAILVLGFKSELVSEFLEKYAPPGDEEFEIQIVNQFEILGPKEKEYGTACPLKCVMDIVEEDFIYLNGDNLFSIKDLKSMNIDDQYNYVAGLEHSNPEKYGVLVKDGGDFLEKIVEKPKEYVGNIINAGLYKFTPEVFEKLSLIKKSSRGEYEITDAISLLAEDKKVKIKIIKDFWHDFGSPADVEKLSKFIKDGGNKVK
jgi:NDP-sugar pyrophosphorylase family protein